MAQNDDLSLGTALIRKGEAKGLDPALAVGIAIVIAVPTLSLCGKAVAALRGADVGFDDD